MESTSKKSKKKLVILLAVAAVIVIGAAAGVFMYNDGIGAVDSKSDEAVTVDIPSGSGAMQIIDILDENGLIKNKTMAKIHVKLSGYDSLQANTYIFTKDMDLKEIMTAINTGDFNYLSKNLLTIVEGSTVPQAAAAISEKLNISSDELIALWNDRDYLDSLIEKYWFLTDEILQDGIMYPLEGYLYPETYTVTDQNITAEGITEQILDYTDSVLSERKDDHGHSRSSYRRPPPCRRVRPPRSPCCTASCDLPSTGRESRNRRIRWHSPYRLPYRFFR